MRRGRAILMLCGAAAASIAAVTYTVGWALSHPVPAHLGPPPPELGGASIDIPSRSGATIRGWLTHGEGDRGAILLLPGVRANRRSMLGRARFLHDAGYTVLSIDFQASGESAGEAITFGWRERFDVLAAVDRLRRDAPGRPIGIIGTSLGGAATLLAAPPLEVQAIVLEAVYPSIDAAVENRLRLRAGAAGTLLAPLLLAQLGPRLGVRPSDLRPIDHIASVRCPVFVVAGENDQHTTLADTQRLFAAAREPKTLWLIPGAAHIDYLQATGDDYRHRILAFIDGAFRARLG